MKMSSSSSRKQSYNSTQRKSKQKKPSKLKRPSKVSKKTAIRLADSWFSKYIRARDRRCVLCGATTNLTCGHLFSRAHYSTRWDDKNAFCQCAGCNLKHEHDPYPFFEYARRVLWSEIVERTHEKWSTPSHYKTNDILAIADLWKDAYRRIDA